MHADLRKQQFGPFFAALDRPIGAALDEVAAAMAEVMADGARRGKGDLSTALNATVDERLRPWCHGLRGPPCRRRPVPARVATRRPAADPQRRRLGRLRRRAARWPRPEDPAGAARRELVRRFLRYAGPTSRDGLAAWLGLSPAAARRWWDLADVVPVEVDGRRLFLHPDDLDAARAAPPARGVRLLPPYDPVLELGDRDLLVPDPAHRKQVWRATANPGVVLVDGAVAGTWRRRKGTITVTPFAPLSTKHRRALATTAGEEVVVAES